AEWGLAVDVPFAVAQRRQIGAEGFRVGQLGMLAEEPSADGFMAEMGHQLKILRLSISRPLFLEKADADRPPPASGSRLQTPPPEFAVDEAEIATALRRIGWRIVLAVRCVSRQLWGAPCRALVPRISILNANPSSSSAGNSSSRTGRVPGARAAPTRLPKPPRTATRCSGARALSRRLLPDHGPVGCLDIGRETILARAPAGTVWYNISGEQTC